MRTWLPRRVVQLLMLVIMFHPRPGLAQATAEASVRALLAAGQEEAAMAAARDWTLREPWEPRALVLCGRLLAEMGQHAEAAEALEAAWFLTRDPALAVERALLELDSGRAAEAEALLRGVLRDYGDYAPAQAGLARIVLEAGKPLEAEAEARIALGMDPQDAAAMVVEGRARARRGDLKGAREVLSRARLTHPDDPDVLLWLGSTAAEAGDDAGAGEAWRAYIAAVPWSRAAWLLGEGFYPVAREPYALAGAMPAVSPDGSQVAFRGGGDGNQVRLAPVRDPAQSRVVYTSTGTVQSLDWSPDGRQLLVREHHQVAEAGVTRFRYAFVLLSPGAGTEPQRLLESSYLGNHCWSPDGQEIWFDGYLTGRMLVALPVAGGDPHPALVARRGETLVSCSRAPDGSRLLLQRATPVRPEGREYQLYLARPTGEAEGEAIAHSPQQLQNPVFSPDGRHVLFVQRSAGQWEVMVLPLDRPGAQPRALLRGLRSIAPVAFVGPDTLITFDDTQWTLSRLAGLR